MLWSRAKSHVARDQNETLERALNAMPAISKALTEIAKRAVNQDAAIAV
jgi:hypothetical protein